MGSREIDIEIHMRPKGETDGHNARSHNRLKSLNRTPGFENESSLRHIDFPVLRNAHKLVKLDMDILFNEYLVIFTNIVKYYDITHYVITKYHLT